VRVCRAQAAVDRSEPQGSMVNQRESMINTGCEVKLRMPEMSVNYPTGTHCGALTIRAHRPKIDSLLPEDFVMYTATMDNVQTSPQSPIGSYPDDWTDD
jgi:hypothetical protein